MYYSKKYTVLDSQIDISGHMSNVEYYSFFKSLFFSFLKDINFKELTSPQDLWPIVFNEACEFKKELYFDEEIEVRFQFSNLSKKNNKWTIEGQIINKNSELCAQYTSTHGIMDRSTRKISPLPDDAILVLKKYLTPLEN